MNLLDVAIVALAIGFSVSGFRRGLSWVGLSLAGLFLGILVGTLVAPPISRFVAAPPTSEQTRAWVATGVFLASVFLFQGVGATIGFRVRLRVRTLASRVAALDSGLGAVVALAGVLMCTWYLGLTFQDSRFATLDRQIQQSEVIRTLDSFAPTVPAPLAQIRKAIADSGFPNVFAGLGGSSLARVPIPAQLDTRGTETATRATVKVLADSAGCGTLKSGSGWPITPTAIVTNAHVVAGSDRVEILTADGRTRRAIVVFFNPDDDVAVLSVPGAGFVPLPLSASDPAPRTIGVVIGYPQGGDERVVPAAIRGEEPARGYNIFNTGEITRTVEVLAASVVPGNSGGPVVDTTGTVVGLVFAASTTDSSEAYALAPSQIRDELAAGSRNSTPVDTQGCS